MRSATFLGALANNHEMLFLPPLQRPSRERPQEAVALLLAAIRRPPQSPGTAGKTKMNRRMTKKKMSGEITKPG